MDIEGWEIEAVRSDAEWIRKKKPTIWIECNENPEIKQVFSALKWAGYNIYYFAFPSFRKNNYLRNMKPIFPCAYEAGLLALKPGQIAALSDEAKNNECLFAVINEFKDLKEMMWQTPRWALDKWTMLSRPELIALLARNTKNEDYVTFLSNAE